jgi:hypothetical protein
MYKALSKPSLACIHGFRATARVPVLSRHYKSLEGLPDNSCCVSRGESPGALPHLCKGWKGVEDSAEDSASSRRLVFATVAAGATLARAAAIGGRLRGSRHGRGRGHRKLRGLRPPFKAVAVHGGGSPTSLGRVRGILRSLGRVRGILRSLGSVRCILRSGRIGRPRSVQRCRHCLRGGGSGRRLRGSRRCSVRGLGIGRLALLICPLRCFNSICPLRCFNSFWLALSSVS